MNAEIVLRRQVHLFPFKCPVLMALLRQVIYSQYLNKKPKREQLQPRDNNSSASKHSSKCDQPPSMRFLKISCVVEQKNCDLSSKVMLVVHWKHCLIHCKNFQEMRQRLRFFTKVSDQSQSQMSCWLLHPVQLWLVSMFHQHHKLVNQQKMKVLTYDCIQSSMTVSMKFKWHSKDFSPPRLKKKSPVQLRFAKYSKSAKLEQLQVAM